MNTINDTTLQKVLKQLHQDAKKNFYKTVICFIKGKLLGGLKPEHMKDSYMAMTDEQGKLMYGILRATNSKNIVEFGTSFGISTLYLASAAKDNNGKVITTELLPEKSATARQNFINAGLENFIELREGDAMKTLANISEPIDFLLLDGWKDLYSPLFKMLEPKFIKGTVVITDNTNFTEVKEFIKYLHSHPDKYYSIPLSVDKGATEFTVIL